MKLLYKYPQAEYPVPAARSKRTSGAQRQRPGVRAARHRHLRRRPLLRHLRRVREGRRRRTLRSASTVGTAARGRARCTSCRTSGSATPGPGATSATAEPIDRARAIRARASSPASPTTATAEPLRNLPFEYRLGARHLYAPAGGQRAVHRQRDERAAASSAPGRTSRSPTSRTRSIGSVVNGEDCVNPDAGRHQGLPRTTASVVPAGGSVVLRLRLTPEALADPLADVDAIDRAAQGRGRRVLRRDPAAAAPARTRSCVQRQALRRHAVDEADLPLRREPLARGRQPAVAAARVAPADPQRALAASELDAHPVDARQVGVPVVRRLGPRLPLRRRSRWSIPSSPRSSSGCCCSSSSSTPTARSRPTSGSSPT